MITETHHSTKPQILSEKAERLIRAHDKAVSAERANLDIHE